MAQILAWWLNSLSSLSAISWTSYDHDCWVFCWLSIRHRNTTTQSSLLEPEGVMRFMLAGRICNRVSNHYWICACLANEIQSYVVTVIEFIRLCDVLYGLILPCVLRMSIVNPTVPRIPKLLWFAFYMSHLCLPCAYLVWPCLEVNPHDKA